MVSAIEKYLSSRGYATLATGNSSEEDLQQRNSLSLPDDDSDDEIDESYEQNPISSSSK